MEFGALKIDAKRRQLLVDGTPVSLGTRAYEIAHLLVEARGELVSKDEIMRHVWPGTIVEENNIQVAVWALRKALGEHAGVIRTIAGRGYRLVADSAPTTTIKANLPGKTKSFVGRDEVVKDIERLLGAHRVVTLTGPGGMGKTCLAVEMGRRLLPQFPDGVWLVELGAVADVSAVPHAVASALGLKIPDNLAQPERIASLVRSRKLLLILDNCEHLIDAVADFVHTLMLSSSNLQVLATSREPLRIGSEALYRVSPLGVPPADTQVSDQLLRFGAIELFVERMRAIAPDFAFDSESVAAIASICRRLDGIPLAIEIVASWAATLGVVELSRHLDDQFRVLTTGFRTTLPRHRTLQATFDWSYDLLTAAEQRGLRRLALPIGRFTLDMAKTLLDDDRDPPQSIEKIVAGLVQKSLIAAEAVRGSMRYRLLETVRTYALAKLRESGEFNQVARRHAEYWRDLLGPAELDWQGHAPPDSLGNLEGSDPLGNARAAIDWAFSPTADAILGLRLTIAAVPIWMHLSRASECRQYVARALDVFAVNKPPDPDLEMRLLTAHGMALLSTMVVGAEARRAFERALEIAEQLGNRDYHLRILCGLCSVHVGDGDFRVVREIAQHFHELASASGDPRAAAWADLHLGGAASVLGDLTAGRRHIESSLQSSDADADNWFSGRFPFNRRVLALGFLGNILWLQGHVDQSKRKLEESVEEAVSNDHVLSLCYTLGNWACVLMLERGDFADAERYVAMVADHSSRYGLDFWLLWARGFRGALAARHGDLSEGVRILRKSVAKFSGVYEHPRFTRLRALYADALYRAEEDAEALTVVEESLDAAERNGHLWMVPEFLRIKGCALARQSGPRMHQEADKVLRRALDLTRQQASLSSQLRVAISLVRLWRTSRQAEGAISILRDTYGQFREGFETTDLKEARALLETN